MNFKKIILALSLSLALAGQDQNIFYKDADIKTFSQDIALLTNKTVILDPRVKGVISVYSDAALDTNSIWEVYVSTMEVQGCLLYTSPSPRDLSTSRMPSSA